MLFCLKEVNCLIEMVDYSCDGNTKGCCWMYVSFPLLPAIVRNSKNGPFSPICNPSQASKIHVLFGVRSCFSNPLRKAEPDLWPRHGCHEANWEWEQTRIFFFLIAQLIFFTCRRKNKFQSLAKFEQLSKCQHCSFSSVWPLWLFVCYIVPLFYSIFFECNIPQNACEKTFLPIKFFFLKALNKISESKSRQDLLEAMNRKLCIKINAVLKLLPGAIVLS